MITSANCFESATFCQWWHNVETAAGDHGWDDGWVLDFLVDLFNAGTDADAAAAETLHEWRVGQAEAWMEIPSWA